MVMPARLYILLCVLQIHHDIVDEAIRLSYQGDRLSPVLRAPATLRSDV